MFGIKTKKDKRIEELQKEINSSKTLVTKIFYSEFVLPHEALATITEEQIKTVLATKMLEVLKENMEIEYTTHKLRQLVIYRGKLEILKGVK